MIAISLSNCDAIVIFALKKNYIENIYYGVVLVLSWRSSASIFHGGIPTPRLNTLPERLTAITIPFFTISASPCRTARSVSFFKYASQIFILL
jgi:hypothetical protein